MNHSPDLIAATLKMVLALGFVLTLVWVLQRWIRRALPGGGGAGGAAGNRWITVLGCHCLGIKKSIVLVRVPGSVLVLGVSPDHINLLTRIEDPGVLASLHVEGEELRGSSFREQLQRMIRPLGRSAVGDFSPDSSKGIPDHARNA